MSWWSVVLVVLAAVVALVSPSEMDPQALTIVKLVGLTLLAIAGVAYVVSVQKRKAFAQGFHLWSTPQQQDRP